MNVEELKSHLDTLAPGDYQVASLHGVALPRKYSISLRPSKYGLGVFADESIPSGVAVTLYPAHVFGKKKGNGHEMNVVKDIPYETRKEYMLGSPTGDIICGYPEMVQSPWYVGHMLNDASDISCFKKKREYESAVIYNIMSQSANTTVEWYNGVPMMVTRRPIDVDEELCMAYGTSYWFASLGFIDATKRISAFIMKQPLERREKMMMLLTSMGAIFKEAERLKTEIK
jgi:hypothetical protein